MKVEVALRQLIISALSELKLTWPAEALLERPTQSQHGDYATNLALVLYSQLDFADDTDQGQSAKKSSSANKRNYQSPWALAEAIVVEIKRQLAAAKSLPPMVTTIEVAGPGFINFTLSEHFLLEGLTDLLTKDTQLTPNTHQGKKVIVEYSSPNIAKPFTVGHLRSTIIGDAVANLLEKTGARVLRDNHLGDWGTQFGKQIYALKTWGDETEIEQAERPVEKLVELYVKFHQEADENPELEDKARAWFKKLEGGDAEARRLWQKCVDWSWQEFEQIYQRLNVRFSQEFNDGRGLGESFFEDKMQPIIKELEEKNLLKEGEEGAKLFFFPENEAGEPELPPAMILKKDGATLYHTRDLATDKYRLENYHPDLVINEVGAEQSLYFRQLFRMEELLGWYEPEQRIHIKHGLYRFKDKKMSTRRGNVIWLEEVLQEAYDRVALIAEDRLTQEQIWKVAVGALKWNDLKRKPELNVVFDWDEIIRLEGNAGPYLQYTVTRALSVLRKIELNLLEMYSRPPVPRQELEPLEKELLGQLLAFEAAVEQAAQELAPHQVSTYLFELAQIFNRFYHQHQILQAKSEVKKELRLQLTAATARVLTAGLALLGIETLEEM